MISLAVVDGIDARAERALELVLAERRRQRQSLEQLSQRLLAGRLLLGGHLVRRAEGDIGAALALRRPAQPRDEVLHVETRRRDHVLEIAEDTVHLRQGLPRQ